MNTNSIKSFAKQARLMLLHGVTQRLTFWGFDEAGQNNQTLDPIQGGFIFRGVVYTDTTLPRKWNALKTRLKTKQAVLDVREEAAYTWFNRLMAIKILESNGYIEPTLAFAEGMRTPVIVQNAKNGIHKLTKGSDKELLLEYLQEDKEEQAFGLLITDLCHRNQVLEKIFGRIDDYTEILLPNNFLQKDGLLDLINSDAIALEDYKEVELIGWLYQFYISDKKDEVFAGFKKNKKARAEDIPAATQIFTPKWIVKYMVENTVGKVYLDYEPTSSLKSEMKYLVVNDSDEIRSSSGVEKAIISDITELSLIDPASGSGHILVTGFELLFKMYREEGYTAKQAVDNILEHNLFGLDIDDRAMQLARFAVLLKAAQFDADVLNRGLIPHVYSFPEATSFTTEELQSFLGSEGITYTAELKEALKLLNQGKNVGSALKLSLSNAAIQLIQQQYQTWKQRDQQAALNFEQSSIWNRLQSFLDVLILLTQKYHAVVANPPYMGQNSMNGELKAYLNANYPRSKSDLFAVFIESMTDLLQPNARVGCITMESWMFLSSYEKLRTHILDNYSIESLIHLGWHIIGIAFGTATLVLEKSKPTKKGEYSYLEISDINMSTNTPYQFPVINNNRYNIKNQSEFKLLPNNIIGYWGSEKVLELFAEKKLNEVIITREGMATADNKRFLRNWSEVNYQKIGFNCGSEEESISYSKWFPYNKGGKYRKWFGNNDLIVNYANNGFEIKNNIDPISKRIRSHNYNGKYAFKEGITWSALTAGNLSVRFSPKGFLFDSKGAMGFSEYIIELLAFLNSKVSSKILSIISPTKDYKVGDIIQIPLKDFFHEKTIEKFSQKAVKVSKEDWDSRETSWDYKKSPLFNQSVSLSNAYSTWQEQVSNDFFQLHANEEELNRIFIDIYGLQEELTPEVALKDITILQEELDRNALEALEPTFREQGKEAIILPIDKAEVISQLLSYCVGVFMGRYRLDKAGLNIAHPNPTEEELASYTYNSHPIEIDKDAILPLMGQDCAFPDDALVRTKDLVHAVWGEISLTENINFIHDALGMDLHKWLTEKFWGYHTSMYKKKPIYWLFSSNVKKPQNAAFKVLVYMHRMDKYTVQKIQRNYLYPHQEYIKREIEKLTEHEENLNKHEMKRLEQFRNWELECRDYNEVLKELANQQIEFDLDDGVTVNYAKFEGAVAVI